MNRKADRSAPAFLRRSLLTGAAALVLLAGCGSPQATGPAESRPPAVHSAEALDVFVVEAAIVGEMDRLLDVTAHPPGTLSPDEVLQPLFTLAAPDQEVSIAASAFFAGEFLADEGEGVLGVSGVCGRGWSRDGSRITADPCSAASPVTTVQPGFATTIPFTLYPRTESGQVRPGRYQVEIPLADDSSPSSGALRVGFQAVPRDPGRLPAWPEATVPFRVSLEEAPSVFFEDDPPQLTVRIEDPYRRLLVERSLPEILAEANEPPSFEVLVPPGAWRVVTLLASGGDGRLVRCGFQQTLLESGEAAVLTLVLDRAGVEGTCPRGEA